MEVFLDKGSRDGLERLIDLALLGPDDFDELVHLNPFDLLELGLLTPKSAEIDRGQPLSRIEEECPVHLLAPCNEGVQ